MRFNQVPLACGVLSFILDLCMLAVVSQPLEVPPLWGFLSLQPDYTRPGPISNKKKKQRREIFVKAARGVAFELSSESSFYSTFL